MELIAVVMKGETADKRNADAARWLMAGADGWRLDVVDELPDRFVLRDLPGTLGHMIVGGATRGRSTPFGPATLSGLPRGVGLELYLCRAL